MKILRTFGLILAIIFLGMLLFKGYGCYKWKQEEKRRAPYYENIENTALPGVQVLRDSIVIPYRKERKTLHIYIPPDYGLDSTKRFPVIYMLDGESSFNDEEIGGPEWQLDEVISDAYAKGQQTAIVIGINQAENRDAEYTPFVNEENPEAHGKEFGDWIVNELKAWVDTSFLTDPNPASTVIGGISRSGMMAYYLMMDHPNVFGKSIIQSPSMWVDYERLMALSLPNSSITNKKIFISVGENEGMVMVPHARDIYEKFKKQGISEKQLKFEIIPGEGHWNLTWRKSFALAYPWLFFEDEAR